MIIKIIQVGFVCVAFGPFLFAVSKKKQKKNCE